MDRVSLRDVKAGEVVWECEGGRNLRMTIKDNAANTGKGYEAIGVTVNDVEVYLYHAYGYEHYGPKLYKNPQYCYLRDGEVHFDDCGENL